MISQQNFEKIINNENSPNNAIKKEQEEKELLIIDEKELLKEKIPLLPSDKNDILSFIRKKLLKINMQQAKIESLSGNICDKIAKYRNLIIEDIFKLIYDLNHHKRKVEYLCLVNEIIKRNFGIEKNELENKNIIKVIKKKFYPYIRGICSDIFFGFNKYNQDAVLYYLNEWDKNQYLKHGYIKEIRFELKMRNEPEITGNKDELKFLMNFVHFRKFKIEKGLIDFSNQVDALDRIKDNNHRIIMIKMEKDLIQKQLRIYNTHIQQIKEINLLLNKIKEFPNLLDENQ